MMNDEKSNTIDREAIIDALNSLRLRTEKQTQDKILLESFVPILSFESLSSSNTQFIFGRNGTGKTHLLRAYNEYSRANYEETRILPVFIDLKDLDLGPVLPSIPVDDLVVRFYRQFIRAIVIELERFSDDVITTTLLAGCRRDKLYYPV